MQAFPDANHTVDDKFKVIYGVEAYLVDDTKDIVENVAGQSLDDKYVVFDSGVTTPHILLKVYILKGIEYSSPL